MQLTVEQIENIKDKHPDFDFEKYVAWHQYIQDELCKPHGVKAQMVHEMGEGC